MLDIVNSLVKDIANTAGNAAGSLTDYQGKTYDPNTILALSKQIAASIDPNAIKGGVFTTKGQSIGFNYDESTKLLGHPPTATEQVVLDMARHLAKEGVTDLNNVDATGTNRRFGSTYTGGGGTIYEIKKDADGKPIISSWSKDTSDKKAILTGLAVAAAAFGIPGVTEGLLSTAPAGATLATVGAEAAGTSTLGTLGAVGSDLAGLSGIPAGAGALTAAESAALYGGTSLAAMTPAELAQLDLATGGAGGTLGAETFANATATGANVPTLTNLTGGSGVLTGAAAGITADSVAQKLAADAATAKAAADAAATTTAAKTTTLIDPTTGLIAKAIGDITSNVANQQGITDARNAITQGGLLANTQLNNAYTNAQNLNAANTTALGNNYQNLNTNLNNVLNAQAGVYNTTGTNLANNYQNLNTNLNNTLNAQAGAYNLANQNINQNAQTQLGLLGSTYQGQKDQAAANAAALNANYNTTLGKMGDVYNQQVGFQQPYQDVGRAGSQGLINNQDYFQHQFNANDLNAQLAPNYAFQLQQGQMANQRAGNMGGGALGGNALKGLQDYTQNYASGAYQNAFNNYNTQRQNIYSTLAGMANIGTTSAGQLAGLGNTYGSNMGSLSSNLGGNLTSNTGNLLAAGNAYGTNTSGVTNNLNSVLSSNLGQMQNAYNQYGSNLTTGSTNYAGNVVNNANQMQGAYNQYGTDLTGASNTYGGNLTTNTGQGINAANAFGLNSANLATGIAGALASNSTAAGANNATALNNLGNLALYGSMIKPT
jgi:hypothetical protein